MKRHDAAPLALLAFTICLLSIVTCQDNGEKAAQLKGKIVGTLPNAQPYQASSTNINAADSQGILNTRLPSKPLTSTTQKGIFRLGLSSGGRDGYVFIPNSYDPAVGAPMIVVLHAAGKGGLDAIGVLYDQAQASGVILLAPDSRASVTWDALPTPGCNYGPDVAFIGAAMNEVFALYYVQAANLAIQGFSDGATYALGLGILNGGRIFCKIMASTPGGIITESGGQGKPSIFISQGTQDPIFAPTAAGNPTACFLKSQGYAVTYVQFAGKHEVPQSIADATMQFFLGTYGGIGSFPAGCCTS